MNQHTEQSANKEANKEASKLDRCHRTIVTMIVAIIILNMLYLFQLLQVAKADVVMEHDHIYYDIDHDRDILHVRGWKVEVDRVQPEVAPDHPMYGWDRLPKTWHQVIDQLEHEIAVAETLLPNHALNFLKLNTWFHLTNDCRIQAAGIAYSEYGPNSVRQTRIVIPCGASGFYSERSTRLANSHDTVMHELAHAWHWQGIHGNYGNNKIEEAYEWLLACGNPDAGGYWKKNSAEFFADMSVALFYKTNRPPFMQRMLPSSIRLMIESAWRTSIGTELPLDIGDTFSYKNDECPDMTNIEAPPRRN